MKFKLHSIILPILSLIYISSASASPVITTFTGEVLGFNSDVGSVSVSFYYDTGIPSAYSATATVGSFGNYAANNFTLTSVIGSHMSFDATTTTGTTSIYLNLYGNFDFAASPDEFGFDRRSNVLSNSYGWPSFDVVLDNASAVTVSSLPDLAPVPVPAAAWLFGSGLVGLVGVARRKNV